MGVETEKLEFLKQSIDELQTRINSSRLYYRKTAYSLYISAAILSAITTILLGLNIDILKDYVRIIALILTTVITVINAYNAFFNNKDLWVAYNTAENSFRQLKFNIEYAEKGVDTMPIDIIDGFKKNFQDILDELNATWQKSRLNAKPK